MALDAVQTHYWLSVIGENHGRGLGGLVSPTVTKGSLFRPWSHYACKQVLHTCILYDLLLLRVAGDNQVLFRN